MCKQNDQKFYIINEFEKKIMLAFWSFWWSLLKLNMIARDFEHNQIIQLIQKEIFMQHFFSSVCFLSPGFVNNLEH